MNVLFAITRWAPFLFSVYHSAAISIESERLKTEELYHAGHQALHVTRIHRYDHTGYESMLEEEQEWHRAAHHDIGDTSSSLLMRGGEQRSFRGADAGSRHQHKFLKLSTVQVSSLENHHREWKEAVAAAQGGNGTDTRPIKAALQWFRNRRKETREEEGIGYHKFKAITGMTALSSQYVGPLGVGNVMKPSWDKCSGLLQTKSASLIQYQEYSERINKSDADEDGEACHSEDESQVWVVYDTGSTNLWISSDLCETGPCVKEGRVRYNHGNSYSYKKPAKGVELTITFGTGKILGPQAIDDFHIGPFTIGQQTFGMIKTEEGSVFDSVAFEGILGLAFPSMSANHVTPFFDTVIQQKALDHNEFAFYFSLDSRTANAVFWGGVDPAFYDGEIEYFPVVDPHYWSLQLVKFEIGDKVMLGVGGDCGDPGCPKKEFAPLRYLKKKLRLTRNTGPYAIVDTGTTYFTAESMLFDKIMQMLPAGPCAQATPEKYPDIKYTLINSAGQHKTFSLNYHQYMVGHGKEGNLQCSPAFMRIDIPQKHGPAMLLGEVFLRNFFGVFDRGDGKDSSGRVGFATARHDETVVKRLRELTKGQRSFHEARSS